MLKKILSISFFTLLLVTPLLFTKLTSELFEYNKMMFVYALTSIITGTWIVRMLSEKKLIFKRTPMDIPLGLFLLSQILSTIFSIDVHTSIWGYYSRSNGGLLSIISYILLYYAFVSNFNKSDVLNFLKAVILSGVLASLYAIPEHFGISPSCIILTNEFTASCWVQDVQARIFGTIGQPNWLAALLGMLIFPAIYFFLTAKNNLSRISYLVSLILMYLAFTFTFSRGATLGLIAGLGVLLLSLLIVQITSLRGIRATNDLAISFLKSFALVAGLFILINIYFGSALTTFKLENSLIAARPSIIQSSGGGTQLENGGTESGQIRLIVWEGALEIFKHYPILGSGVETFAYSYYQFRPAAHNMVSEWDFLYNKAHNEYLNYLATTGAFGFLTYMAIIVVFLLWVMRYVLWDEKGKLITHNSLLITSLSAGYISYLVQDFFLFSVVNVSLLFYLFPAFAFVFTEDTTSLSEKNAVSKALDWLLNLIAKNSISRWVAQGLIILITLITLNSLYNLWEADTFYKIGSDYNDLNNPGRAYTNLIKAVQLNSQEPLYLAELGSAAGSSSIALAADDATTSAELKEDAQFFTDLALSISPVNTTINRTAIRTYFSLALLDPSLQDKTMQIVDQSITLAPTDPKLLHNKGIVLSQFDRMKEATESLQQAIEMKPNYRDARLSLADLYIKNGQKDLAQMEIDAVLKQIPGDPDALKLEEQLK
jgi:putative inorganic carbon (hco3(-)) transporter